MREAIIHLSDRDLAAIGLDEVVGAARAAGLVDVTELDSEGVHQVRVEEPIPEADLAALDAIEWWERVDESNAGVTYLWKLTVPACEDGCPLDQHSTAYAVSDVRGRGFDLSIIGSQTEISRAVEEIADAGPNVRLQRLTEYTGSESTVDGLTERQREVVETAYEMGYYEVPRVATTETVAEAVGLDPSTVTEHLQRAERNLLGTVLAPAD